MDLNELLVDPTGVQTWRLGESELLISTTELSQRICELEALRLRMVTDLDMRGTAKTLGASSTAAWLAGATRMSPGAASGMVHLGRALTEVSATAEELAAGRISTAHAKVVTGFFAHLPDGVPADALPPCEPPAERGSRGQPGRACASGGGPAPHARACRRQCAGCGERRAERVVRDGRGWPWAAQG